MKRMKVRKLTGLELVDSIYEYANSVPANYVIRLLISELHWL